MSKICASTIPIICLIMGGANVEDSFLRNFNPRPVPVSVIIPRYVAPAIIYQFIGRSPVIVPNGDRYELDEEIQYNLGDYTISFDITRENRNAQNQFVRNVTDKWAISITNGIFGSILEPTTQQTGGFGGTCLPWRGLGYNFTDSTGATITRRIPQNGSISGLNMTCVQGGGAWNSRNNYKGISNVIINQTSGLPPSIQCTIRVYDKNNNLLVTDIGSPCPEVEKREESCELNYEDELPWYTAFEGNQLSYFSVEQDIQNGKKCIVIKDNIRNIGTPFFGGEIYVNNVVAVACSEEGCDLYPLACVDCPDEEECEECPEGTTSQILEGNTIHCVIDNCIVKSITYDPSCHTPDCFC